MKKNKRLSLLLAAVLILSLTSCGGGAGTGREDITPSPDPVVSDDPVPSDQPAEPPDEEPPIEEPPVEEPSPEPPASMGVKLHSFALS